MHQNLSRLSALFAIITFGCQSFRQPHDLFTVKNFGALADGKHLDSPAINRAIDAAARSGGGTVHLAAGTYRCYSIHLKSNVALCLEQGATILAAELPATQPT